ncbi:hypothetical protein MRX96_053332 [Rhipicephalus microplus]
MPRRLAGTTDSPWSRRTVGGHLHTERRQRACSLAWLHSAWLKQRSSRRRGWAHEKLSSSRSNTGVSSGHRQVSDKHTRVDGQSLRLRHAEPGHAVVFPDVSFIVTWCDVCAEGRSMLRCGSSSPVPWRCIESEFEGPCGRCY